MKKMKKEEELMAVLSDTLECSYLTKFGLCTPTLIELFDNHREIFDKIITLNKKIPQEVIEQVIESREKSYLPLLKKQCMDAPNQVLFVQIYPNEILDYIQTLEKVLQDGRGAYLTPEAQDEYDAMRKANPSLPEIPRFINVETTK